MRSAERNSVKDKPDRCYGKSREEAERTAEMIFMCMPHLAGSELGREHARTRAVDTILFGDVSRKLREAREKRSISVKEVSAELKIPQYRIKAIETGMFVEMLPGVLREYACFLDLSDWVERWMEKNRELVDRYPIL